MLCGPSGSAPERSVTSAHSATSGGATKQAGPDAGWSHKSIETAELGDNVYLMHDVTLGATGTSGQQDRHPKIGSNVFLGAKCTVLGNITVGDGATVAAAALVNKAVPDGYTAVGVPARLIAPNSFSEPEGAKPVDIGKAK